jgi:hypothetical protein
MKTYQITLARNETRVVIVNVEAATESEAEDIAHELLEDTDFSDAETVYGEEWIQDTQLKAEVTI